MKALTGLLIALRLATAAAQAAPARNTSTPAGCKALPGDSEWPAPEVWTRELPGIIANPPKDEKDDSTRPDYEYAAKTPKEVQNALRFATKYNVRLVIINSGSDFLGRNNAASGLQLVLGNLKGVRVSQNFTATREGVASVDYSSPPVTGANAIQPAKGKQAYVTFGAGVSGQELNDGLDKSALFVMAAATSSVRVAGGYGQGGGHAPFSSKYGLAADHFVEFKVVTADGTLRIANSVSNADLFWALRGGGGGNYGIVVEATMKAFPTPKITQTRWWIKTTNANDTTSIFEPAAYIMSQFPALNARGVQGYFFIYPTSMWAEFLTADEDFGAPAAKRLWSPILAGIDSFPGVTKPIYQYSNYDTFKQWFDDIFQPLPPFDAAAPVQDEGAAPLGIVPMDSRLLGASHLTSPQLAKAMRDAMPFSSSNGMLRGHLVAGGQLAKLGSDTSVNPAWRKALVHLIATGAGVTPNATSLKQLAPDMGCYSNECSYRETSFKTTMFGSNYNRLLSIKRRYDPKGLFWVSPGVAADDYVVRGSRLCNVLGVTNATMPAAPAGGWRPSPRPKGPSLGLNQSSNPLGTPPAFDNNVFAHNEGDVYRQFPPSQAYADKNAPNLSKGGNGVKS